VIRESQVPSETKTEELLIELLELVGICFTPEELLDSPIEEIPEELDSFVTVTEEELDSSVPIEELESSEAVLMEPLSPPHPAKDMIEIRSNPRTVKIDLPIDILICKRSFNCLIIFPFCLK